MSEKEMLKLILEKVTALETDIKDIKAIQLQHGEQIKTIMEQTARNTEMTSDINKIEKRVRKLEDDNILIKRAIAN